LPRDGVKCRAHDAVLPRRSYGEAWRCAKRASAVLAQDASTVRAGGRSEEVRKAGGMRQAVRDGTVRRGAVQPTQRSERVCAAPRGRRKRR